jgi:hypothetical protein
VCPDANPLTVLHAGAAELEQVLGPAGFRFVPLTAGHGSGGPFAYGEFRRDDRRLELHYRWGLGLVCYHVGEISLPHEEYVRAVRAVDQLNEERAYPGFTGEALAGFRHLGEDLGHFGRRFLQGDDAEFRELASWVERHPRPTGFAALEP